MKEIKTLKEAEFVLTSRNFDIIPPVSEHTLDWETILEGNNISISEKLKKCGLIAVDYQHFFYAKSKAAKIVKRELAKQLRLSEEEKENFKNYLQEVLTKDYQGVDAVIYREVVQCSLSIIYGYEAKDGKVLPFISEQMLQECAKNANSKVKIMPNWLGAFMELGRVYVRFLKEKSYKKDRLMSTMNRLIDSEVVDLNAVVGILLVNHMAGSVTLYQVLSQAHKLLAKDKELRGILSRKNELIEVFFWEVTRLSASAYPLKRSAVVETNLDGIKIEKGEDIYIRLKELFKELSDSKEIELESKPKKNMIFGKGPRMCPGTQLSWDVFDSFVKAILTFG